ncbi:hypothetical protein Tco_0378449 [Tanacetum coccineum]
MSGSQDEIPPPPPPPPSSSQTPTQQTPHTVSTIKLPILKKGEYDIWAMKMEHYLAHTDYPIWEVIQNGNGPRFGRKYESRTDAEVYLEGNSLKDSLFLNRGRKPGVDNLSFDDLYNNLRVFENDVKGSTASSSSSQNVAFVSENTNSTNDVSTAYSVSNTFCQIHKYEQTSSYSLLANQSSCPQLDHENLEQLDEYDLEEMDLKWQMAMISMIMKKFYKKTDECRIKGNQDNRMRDAWNFGNKDVSRTGKKEDSKVLVTIDGEAQNPDSEVWSDAPIIEEYESDIEDETSAFQSLSVPQWLTKEQGVGHVNLQNKLKQTSKGKPVRGLPSNRNFKMTTLVLLVRKESNTRPPVRPNQIQEQGCLLRIPCGVQKEIKREYSNARTPQQNGVAERKNRTLIKGC